MYIYSKNIHVHIVKIGYFNIANIHFNVIDLYGIDDHNFLHSMNCDSDRQ